jgi:hypothetical protein
MSQRYLGGVITANPTTPTMTNESGVWTLEQQFQYSNVWSPKIIGNSLRFRQGATAYLSRTYGTPTSPTTGTISFWYKRGLVGSGTLITAFGTVSTTTGNGPYIQFSADNLRVIDQSSDITTTAVFRDPSAWYHIVVAIDTTQATAANRVKIYVNGVQYTAFNSATYGAQNYASSLLASGSQYIGYSQPSNARGSDGYMAECYFVDGQALTPSSFGAFDSTGVWQPLPYTGAYGTNGFYLNFSNTTSTTTLGYDTSGNGNNWTTNNFSLTAGATYDAMIDSPTNYPGTSTGVGNYNTLLPTAPGTGTISNANLTSTSPTTTVYSFAGTTLITTGKWYWEVTATTVNSGNNYPFIGAYTVPIPNSLTGSVRPGADTGIGGFSLRQNGSFYYNGSTSGTITTSFTSGDVIGIAFDADGQSVTYYKNGVSIGTQGSLGAGPWVTAISEYNGSLSNHNFGQRPFSYTPPTGFQALNTQNLPVNTINNGATVMAATTYTGTGASLSVSNGNNNTTGVTFKPDLVWIKSRSATTNNNLFDSVRGTTNYLISNSTAAEASNANTLTAFGTGGFTVGSDASAIGVNVNAATYIGWQWQAGQGTTSSNTNGSITSTVSVNATAGFSIARYTGTGANATVGHGLGVAPSMIIVKNTSSTQPWTVGTALPGGWDRYLTLNTTDAVTLDGTVWNTTNPTSSVFSIGTSLRVNGNGGTYVAYCWAQVAGFSKFGSYTGNGSTDGPFLYFGFRPRWIMYKRTDSTGNWNILDTSRDTINAADSLLRANLSNAEEVNTVYAQDFLSNGWKIRSTNVDINTSGATYIFAAFAENPFKISRAR